MSALRHVGSRVGSRLAVRPTASAAVPGRSIGLGPNRLNPVMCYHYMYTHYFGCRTSDGWFPRYISWNFPRDIIWIAWIPFLLYFIMNEPFWRNGVAAVLDPFTPSTPKGDLAKRPGNSADFETNPHERAKWINPFQTHPFAKGIACDVDYVPNTDADQEEEDEE
eukprot:TRINITY_DN48283_c0_g1_i1.p2 TRINITY_DN48283_c0_g1~~TRINITY_DN48283_c0_g1_i1.p2  ORF type:complete len:165 (+),score=22.63 TRINITY_DN48283_c0_g1_i1:65-559(+)